MRFRIFLTLGLFLVVVVSSSTSCQKENLEGEVVNDSELASQLLTKSCDSVVLDNQILVLETELYRDFFPGMPSGNRSNLQALIWVVNVDSSNITNRFAVSRMYIINESELWISEPEDRNDDCIFDFKYHAVSVNGPQWDTGIKVDVVVELIDLNDDQHKNLVAKNQVITRIE